MDESSTSNMSSIQMFIQMVDRFETSVHTSNYYVNQNAGHYLQLALNRLITSSTSDSYQMIYHLAKRIIKFKDSFYKEDLLINLAATTTNVVFKDEILSIMLTFVKMLKEGPQTLDHIWTSRINGNQAIIDLFTTFPSSDLNSINNCTRDNVITTPSHGTKKVIEDPIYSLELDQESFELKLILTQMQTLKFKKSVTPHYPNSFSPHKPSVITSSILVETDYSEFTIDRSVKFTPLGDLITTNTKCLKNTIVSNRPTIMMLPSVFHKVYFDLFSTDLGQTWTISNCRIITPYRQ